MLPMFFIIYVTYVFQVHTLNISFLLKNWNSSHTLKNWNTSHTQSSFSNRFTTLVSQHTAPKVSFALLLSAFSAWLSLDFYTLSSLHINLILQDHQSSLVRHHTSTKLSSADMIVCIVCSLSTHKSFWSRTKIRDFGNFGHNSYYNQSATT